MRFYSSTALGRTQSLTPEGFLICRDVPIARTGVMVYGDGETPVEVGRDGIARIERMPDEVFRPETLASFEGKPVTLDHPSVAVGPGNWRDLTVGTVQNVRRGAGAEDDLLLADLLITTPDAIEAVRSGLREVSCGYDAEYEQTEPGRGVQRNIIGNHLALVEQGRCGPRCAIGDSKETSMPKTVWDRLRAAFKSKDSKAFDEAMEEAEVMDAENEEEEEGKGKAKTGDALDTILRRLDATDKAVADLAAQVKDARAKDEAEEEEGKKKTEDEEPEEEKKQTGDALRASWQDALSRAEILSPGIKVPTADAARTADALCACKRNALKTASAGDHADALKGLLAGRDPEKLTGDALDALFVAAAEIVRSANNARGVRSNVTTRDFGRRTSVADMNKRAAEVWSGRAAK